MFDQDSEDFIGKNRRQKVKDKILVKKAGKFSGCFQLFISDLDIESFKSSVKQAREEVKDIVKSEKLPECNERVISTYGHTVDCSYI